MHVFVPTKSCVYQTELLFSEYKASINIYSQKYALILHKMCSDRNVEWTGFWFIKDKILNLSKHTLPVGSDNRGCCTITKNSSKFLYRCYFIIYVIISEIPSHVE